MSSFARGVLRGATGGLGNLATALAQGDATQRMAADREGLLQSKLAAQLTQQQRDMAAADFDAARAENERLKADFAANRPALQEEQAALMSGVDLPLVRAIRESIRTGRAPQMEMAGPTEDGSPLMGDLQVDPKQRSAVAQALSRTLPLVSGAGEVKVDDWAKALGAFADQDLQGQAVRGELPQDQQDRALAVLKASPLFKVPEGYVGNQFSGAVDVSNPVNATRQGLVQAQTGAQKANAVQSYAAAGASKASADKTRAETPLPGQAPKADFKDTTAIRKEFEDRAEVKNFRQAMPVLDAARNAPNTPQGDLQLIYGVGKVLDPNSVVREGEMSLVIKSGSPAERLDGFISYLQGGGRLSPKARERLVKALESRTQEYQRDYNTVRKSYEALAQRRGLDTTEVFMNDRTPQPAAPAARTVVRTGTLNGRRVVQYSDGTTDYAD